MSSHRTRLFVLAGGIGVLLALCSSALLFVATRFLVGTAWLAPDRIGTSLWAALWLALLGLLVTAEIPLMTVVLLRSARSRVPTRVLSALHLAYTAFPAVYGAMGTVLTGERWWLLLTALFAPLRLLTSLFIIPTVGRQGDEPAPTTTQTTEQAPPLASVEGFLLDMDGVLYRGNQVRDGAEAFIRYLNAQRRPYLCVTNNASMTSEMFEQKLHALGLPIGGERVLGSARATAAWLAGQLPSGARVLPIGEAGLREELTRQGFMLVEHAPADAVVVGIDRSATYERLAAAANAIHQGARFIGTNADATFPVESALMPGNGALLAFIQTATMTSPTIIGKPNRAMMQVALTQLGLPADRVVMIGDRLDTDILGGQQSGMTTVLLRGGVTADDTIRTADIYPDQICDDLGDVLEWLQAIQDPRSAPE